MREAYYSGVPGVFTSGTAWLLLSANVSVWLGAFTGGLIEYIFGIALFFMHKSKHAKQTLDNNDASGAS